MILDLVAFVVGLAVLVYAADQFVMGAARLADLLDMPEVIIGAVVLGFGTSAPELVVSAVAAAGGDQALGVGNIVGSNVANLSLVLGTAALVTTMGLTTIVLRREVPMSLGASVLFALAVVDGDLSRIEGVLLVVGLTAAVAYLVRAGVAGEAAPDPDEEPSTMSRESLRAGAGLVGVVVAAQLVVTGATGIADTAGISKGFIGFSLVALGTSLPELVTTVAGARRSETQLIVGNLFGSNIFNSFAVGGAMGLVGPGDIDDSFLTGVGLLLMLAVGVLAFGLGAYGRYLGPRDGIALLTAYVVCMVVLAVGDASSEEDEAAVRPFADPPVSVAYCCQPASEMPRASKNRHPSGQAKGASWFTSSRHRWTTSSGPMVRLE